MELSNKISAATLARTAVLLLALTNQVLSAMGKPVLPIESTTSSSDSRMKIKLLTYDRVGSDSHL